MTDPIIMEMLRVLVQQSEHVSNMLVMQTRLAEETRKSEGYITPEVSALQASIKEEGRKVSELTNNAKTIYRRQ